MKTLTWQKPGQQNVAQELIKIIINYVAELRKKKKTEQKDELMENDRRYPVEQVSNTGEPTKKEVKAAVKELNPDLNSLGSRG